MSEPTGETPAPAKLITVPEGLFSPEEQARIAESMAPQEPIVDEAAQAIAQHRIKVSQELSARLSAEAVEAARTTNAAHGFTE